MATLTTTADVGPVDQVAAFLADKEYYSDSGLGMFNSCRRKFMYAKHWLLDGARWSGPADAGSVLHYGLAELHRSGGDIEKMFQAAEFLYDKVFDGRGDVELRLQKGNLLDILLEYVKRWRSFPYQVEPNNVEVGIVVKIQDFWYVCRLDLLPYKTQYGEGPTVVDFKSVKSLQDFGNKWSPNRQFTGNIYCARRVMPTTNLFAIADGILVNSSQRDFTRWKLPRQQRDLDEWERDTIEHVRLIRDARDRNTWPQNTRACNDYGRCPFDELCITHVNPVFIRNYAKTSRTDPLHFRD